MDVVYRRLEEKALAVARRLPVRSTVRERIGSILINPPSLNAGTEFAKREAGILSELVRDGEGELYQGLGV